MKCISSGHCDVGVTFEIVLDESSSIVLGGGTPLAGKMSSNVLCMTHLLFTIFYDVI